MDMNAVLEIKNYSKSYGAGKKAADLFEITGSLGDLISAYSHGMKQKVAIISALIHDPKQLVLDEPFVGLDPKASFTLKAVMHELCARGTAIFFSTHVLDVAEKLCNKVAIIRHGSIIASGTMDELTQGHSLEEVFLEAENETYPSYCIFSSAWWRPLHAPRLWRARITGSYRACRSRKGRCIRGRCSSIWRWQNENKDNGRKRR